MADSTTIAALQDPSVPAFDPLPNNSVPQPPAQIMTTAAVNGSNGSVDNGGPVDQVAARMSRANQWSQETFGMPLAVPSVQSSIAMTTAHILGAFVGGYHGYKRSGGKTLATVGYGLAGIFMPLITLGVAAVQGYAKPRRR
jgi:hypothetical protein